MRGRSRRGLLLRALSLLLVTAAATVEASQEEASLRRHSAAAKARSLKSENEGGKIQKTAPLGGLGSKPELGARKDRTPDPVQTWLHGWMKDMGSKISSHDGLPLLARPYAKLQSGPVLSTSSKDESDGEMTPIDITSNIYMDEGEFEHASEAWMKNNQETMQWDMRWIFLGIFLFVVASGVLVYSEISVVLVQREVDALVIAGKEVPSDLKEKLDGAYGKRTYLSLVPVAAMVVALWMALFALCHMATAMLSTMHYEFTGCYEMAFLVSFVVAAIWSLFLVGLIWVCTRPWTGVMCLLIAFLGELSIEAGSGASPVVLWALLSTGGAWLFFAYGHHFVTDGPKRSSERSPILDRDK